MRGLSLGRRGFDAAAAAVGGAAAVAGSYAVAGASPAFVAAPVNSLVVAYTPDAVVTFAIVVLGGLGQKLGFGLALALTAGLFAAVTLAGLRAASAYGRRAGGAAGTLLALAAAAALTGRPVAAVGAALPVGVVVFAATGLPATPGVDGDRRTLLRLAAGVVALGTGAAAGRRWLADGDDGDVDPEVQSMLDDADDAALGVDGLTGLVSASEEFYEVDINAVDPDLDADGWTLTLTGAVEEETTLTYRDLTELPAERRYETLRCVGETLNGIRMDTAVWTGVPVTDLLDAAGASLPDECCVVLRAADDYYEEFPLAALRRGFLAYGMNGRPLPRKHGHPVRALVPGHWGEINVKWLTEIEVLEREVDGYWEERGWHGTGPVNTVAKLHAINRLADGRVEVGGHAYAGTRGVSAVEVSIDGGETWRDAKLSEPLPGEDVWRQWAYEFEPSGTHEVVVRAVEADGTVQPSEESGPFPSGPTGWVSKEVSE